MAAFVVLSGCATDARTGGDDGGGSAVTVVAANAPDAVIAYRDGDGPWSVTSGAQSPISVPAETGRYTVAVGCLLAGYPVVDVYELTVAETRTLTYERDCGTALGTITGVVSGFATQNTFLVNWGLHRGGASSFTQPGAYAVEAVAGAHDLVAVRGDVVGERLIIVRNAEFSPAGLSHDFDFTGPDAVALTYNAYSPAFGNTGSYSNTLVTAGGTRIQLSVASQDHVSVVPEAAMGPNDLQMVTASGGGGIGSFVGVVATQHISRVAPSSVALPPFTQDRPRVTALAVGATASVDAAWQAQAGAGLYRLQVGEWSVRRSPARFAMDPDLAIPDLTGVVGWDPQFALANGSSLNWSVVAYSGADLVELLREIPTREYERHIVGWAGDIRPM